MALLPFSLRKYRQEERTSVGCHYYLSTSTHFCPQILHLSCHCRWIYPRQTLYFCTRYYPHVPTRGHYFSDCLSVFSIPVSLPLLDHFLSIKPVIISPVSPSCYLPLSLLPMRANSLKVLSIQAFLNSLPPSSLELSSIMLLSPSLPQNNLSISHWLPSWLVPRSMFSLHLTRLFAARATRLHCLLQFLGRYSLSSCPTFPEALNPSHLLVPPHLLVPTSNCWSSSGLSHWNSFLSILILLLLPSNFMI